MDSRVSLDISNKECEPWDGHLLLIEKYWQPDAFMQYPCTAKLSCNRVLLNLYGGSYAHDMKFLIMDRSLFERGLTDENEAKGVSPLLLCLLFRFS